MSEPVEVTVVVPEAEPVEAPEAAPVVVVVEDEAPADDAALAPVIDHESRLTRIEMQQAEILAALERVAAGTVGAQYTADIAVETAVEAQVTAEEAAEEEQRPATEDVAPNNEHWFFK